MVNLPELAPSAISGLWLVELDLRQDARGWFEESWQRAKLESAAASNFWPLQQNISFNESKGTLRGLHAEPWDKYVTVASGRAFCAWVDLRPGDGYGKVQTATLQPGRGAFIPCGVANGYQTLEDKTSYVYLVNGHWDSTETYPAVDPFDPILGIAWPLSSSESKVSDKDLANPPFQQSPEVPARSGYIFGADGQLGRQLKRDFPSLSPLSRSDCDLAQASAVRNLKFNSSTILINSAAYTAVEEAQTPSGISRAFSANVSGVKSLAVAALRSGSTLVHYSTDYVFDGMKDAAYTASDALNPVNVYGLSKAAGEEIASLNPKTYIIRTSWVFGDGENFVVKMIRKALELTPLDVVADQFGRPTSTITLSEATRNLLETRQPFGVYHVTNSGPLASWYEVACKVYECVGADPSLIRPAATDTKPGAAARPPNSNLGISNLPGIHFRDWRTDVAQFVEKWLKTSRP